MELDELASKNAVHRVNVTSMCPVGVVDTRKSDALSIALYGRHHHVRGVDRVDVVRWECCVLLLLVHRLLIWVQGYCYGLQYGLDHTFLGQVLVRLDAW